MALEEGGEVMLSPLAHFGSEAGAQPANTQRQAHIPQVYESTSGLLQTERGWWGQVTALLDRSSGHLIFYNLHENQLNVLKATCFYSGIFKWCGSYFGCSKSLE